MLKKEMRFASKNSADSVLLTWPGFGIDSLFNQVTRESAQQRPLRVTLPAECPASIFGPGDDIEEFMPIPNFFDDHSDGLANCTYGMFMN
jgi:hypothetical protein